MYRLSAHSRGGGDMVMLGDGIAADEWLFIASGRTCEARQGQTAAYGGQEHQVSGCCHDEILLKKDGWLAAALFLTRAAPETSPTLPGLGVPLKQKS
jgi:hypothetical protein